MASASAAVAGTVVVHMSWLTSPEAGSGVFLMTVSRLTFRQLCNRIDYVFGEI